VLIPQRARAGKEGVGEGVGIRVTVEVFWAMGRKCDGNSWELPPYTSATNYTTMGSDGQHHPAVVCSGKSHSLFLSALFLVAFCMFAVSFGILNKRYL